MKKFLLLMLSLFMVTMANAEGVTPKQALEKARNFVQKRENSGNRPKKMPGTAASRLVEAQQVHGLYVFNVAKDEGFVIVSNDDRTEPILGYSDNGHFDPENMPENMRAWLQGYADQIAWLNEHGDEESAVATMPSLTGTPVKQPIAPLMTTLWNQDTPYNDLCPEYATGEKSATGCVATAMAQVMKYHEWPQAQTLAVPGYDKDYNNSPCIPVAALPATVFDWSNMLEVYPYHYDSNNVKIADCTDAEATAVATLMRYCGQSLKMNYGASSGTSTHLVADALKTYFNYATTTTYKDRSHYSYANWIELLYNELSQGRPMVYNGSSSGGGHAFVCDGYQNEDYFHINWGWGGMSDGYFKLSVMNPYSQGIGGSSSDDGFNFGQGAIVGIQKNGGTGTVLDVPTSNFSLSLQSVTFSPGSTIALGETVNVTFRVRNSGPDDYNGDIWVYVNGQGLMTGKTFNIAAGETKDCVVPYTPSGFTGSVNIQAYTPNGFGTYNRLGNASATLTVTQGSGNPTSSNILLGRSIEVENSELVNGNNYNVYGTAFKGTLTVTNSEANTDYYGVYICDLYGYDNNNQWGQKARFIAEYLTVPANSSITIPLEYNGLESGKTYYLYDTYGSNYQNAWENIANYAVKPGIVTYLADGSLSVAKVTSSNFSVPSGVLAVDLTTTTNITSITNENEPNCLVLISSGTTKPSGANNVVVKNGSNYTAETITLTDNHDFYSPVDFTADKVEFNYDFTVAADGTNGWNTLILPFNVTSVTADDAVIDWFHSSSDSGKNFWVKTFDSDESTQVYFDFVDEMKANTPYIVAFPGNKWGKKWDMSNKTLKFIGENVTVANSEGVKSITGSAYRFVGNTVKDNTANIYSLNEQGNLFVLNQSAGSAPFRAFFKPGIFDASVTSLSMGSVTGGTTAIGDLPSTLDYESDVWYSIDGRRLTGKPTQKGVYINNGKKTIIK